MRRMLFNATQQEELRVAIVDGQKLIDIDIETTGKEERKGNIYKGIITRIEPSLEACFINYGEEKHGFLPFKEISKIYFKNGLDVRYANIKNALQEGQEIIVQVEKEERENKGAALTSFISLAGRYLVLMPNNPRGGGVSRRIEGIERNELKESMSKLNIPDGMSIIARTAGIRRNAEELQWDLSYLIQLWKAIDEAAKKNQAPLLIYLESSLVIRAIRDYFQPDIGEILIDTKEIYEQAHAFMSVVMPDNVERVKYYSDNVALFSRFQIEHQIETAYSRTVCLPSGGAIVIDHTEALVSIDVNSARAIRGSDIEETAFRTNLEAVDEIARQMRLRDLGGLIVIDFIDMELMKNQKDVEQRLKEALCHDRARIQIDKISRFGLLELSRQRLRPALSESSNIPCPRCSGIGHIRDTESFALQILRILQEEAMKDNTAIIYCQVPVDVISFLLNEKRKEVLKIESRFKINIFLLPNKHLETPHYKLDRLKYDDPRLNDQKASYIMAENANKELELDKTLNRRELENRIRQKAAVKRLNPSQPAPINTSLINKCKITISRNITVIFHRICSLLGNFKIKKELRNKLDSSQFQKRKRYKKQSEQRSSNMIKKNPIDPTFLDRKKKEQKNFQENHSANEKHENKDYVENIITATNTALDETKKQHAQYDDISQKTISKKQKISVNQNTRQSKIIEDIKVENDQNQEKKVIALISDEYSNGNIEKDLDLSFTTSLPKINFIPLKDEELQSMIDAVGMVWVKTDQKKHKIYSEANSSIKKKEKIE